MTWTDEGTPYWCEWMPLSMANGIEWGYKRKRYKDRWNNLYRRGTLNKILWLVGSFIGQRFPPEWVRK